MMSAPPTPSPVQEAPLPAPAPGTRPLVTEIDASCRGPLLWLCTSGVIWLLIGLVLALLASIKMHAPGFLADYAWLTFGRVRPAALNALLYGFATPTALGVSLWMLCRLGRVRLPAPVTTLIAVMFWNFGVTVGVIAILAQGSTGFEWLDMPGYVAPLLFVAYLIIGIVGLTAFHLRRPLSLHGAASHRRPATYVTQWYIIGGLLWFAWLYSAANLLLLYRPVRGVLQAAVDAWYTNNLFHLWLSSTGLGAIFYFLPKLLGRPLASRRLAAFGFWTLALFGSWTGMTQFIGGPLPAWMVSTSVGANSLLLVPLLAVAINWHLTLRGHYREAWRDVTLRFVLFGAASYLLAVALGVVLGLPGVSRATHFTCLETARTWLGLLGFVLMVLLGSLYYILPRLARVNWPSAAAVRLHFWCSAGGVALLVLALAVGGIIQGVKMNLNTVDFITLGRATVPFLGLATLGWLGLLVGQAFFAANVLALLRRFAEPYRQAAVAGFRRNGEQSRREKP